MQSRIADLSKVPIIEPAPWRHQYFERIACPPDLYIPTDDPEAWEWNPTHRWVFDKLQVALSQGLAAGPHGTMPPQFPVFSKPIMNFRGLGAGSRILHSAEDYEAHHTAGHFWMTLLQGPHVSSDVALVDGEPRWWRHATGLATGEGMFDRWTIHAAADPPLEAACGAWIAEHLRGFSGILNVETIGSRIIEAHLRLSDQWPDLYGAGWTEAFVGLYRDGVWRYADSDRRDGFRASFADMANSTERAVGRSVARKDGLGKATGKAIYADDLVFPGAWYGATIARAMPTLAFSGSIATPTSRGTRSSSSPRRTSPGRTSSTSSRAASTAGGARASRRRSASRPRRSST